MYSSSPAISQLDHNKQLAVRWFEEVWNQGRRDTIFEILGENSVLHDGPRDYRGAHEFARFHDALRSQFSNFKFEPRVLLAEDNRVCVHWSCSCVHTATQKALHITGTSIVQIEGNRFVEAWQNWDAAHLHFQLTGESILAL